MDWYKFILQELSGLYGVNVMHEMTEIIGYYKMYDGKGQDWLVPADLDYTPTKSKTNYIKKLIKEQASFMFSRTPEIKIVSHDTADSERAKELEDAVLKVLDVSKFSRNIVTAARDCFIGKRVALKLNIKNGDVKVRFFPSMEFIYETAPDDEDLLVKVVFFYCTNNTSIKADQRIFKQKYEMQGGRCFVTEGIYNGFGAPAGEIETKDTGLDFIPVYIIINDSLLGESGESDVAEIADNQRIYNKLKSDDNDALRFNMFPQTVVIDADEGTHENMIVAPGAALDVQSQNDDKQAQVSKLESQFGYDERFEHSINRIKNDMYDLLNIPNVGLEQLKGLMQSGKSMEALYWSMITRANEKWAVWRSALLWMTEKIIHILEVKHSFDTDFDYEISIEMLLSLMKDEEAERENDLAEVNAGTRSRLSYIKKWNIAPDPQEEIEQILKEKAMFEDAYINGMIGGGLIEQVQANDGRSV